MSGLRLKQNLDKENSYLICLPCILGYILYLFLYNFGLHTPDALNLPIFCMVTPVP